MDEEEIKFGRNTRSSNQPLKEKNYQSRVSRNPTVQMAALTDEVTDKAKLMTKTAVKMGEKSPMKIGESTIVVMKGGAMRTDKRAAATEEESDTASGESTIPPDLLKTAAETRELFEQKDPQVSKDTENSMQK